MNRLRKTRLPGLCLSTQALCWSAGALLATQASALSTDTIIAWRPAEVIGTSPAPFTGVRDLRDDRVTAVAAIGAGSDGAVTSVHAGTSPTGERVLTDLPGSNIYAADEGTTRSRVLDQLWLSGPALAGLIVLRHMQRGATERKS